MAEEKLPAYGGQAVIEGVMMRGRRGMAIAARTPDGDIKIHTEPLGAVYQSPLIKIPLLRGLVGLWDALGLGMRGLTWSADVAVGEEAEFGGPVAAGTILVSIGFAIGLFFVTPAALGELLESWLNLTPLLTNLLEGAIRLTIVIGYIVAITMLDDIKRLFAYHGAEHKTINAFEAGADLTPEQVKQYSLYHPRCGTSFILIVVLMSVLLFTLLGDLNLWQTILTRILFIPVLAALAYEYLRFTAAFIDNPVIRWLAVPGMWMQRLTTREPDLDIIAVAIAAFNAMRQVEADGVDHASDRLLGVTAEAAVEGAAQEH